MARARKSTFDAPYAEIVQRLVARRHELGMTQAELGEALGEDQSLVSKMERRQRRIDVYEFVRLCRALNIEPVDVLRDIS